MPNNNFEHLPIPIVLQGKPKLRGGGSQSPRTNDNRNNRVAHGSYIKHRTVELSQFWRDRRVAREQEQLPHIDYGIPILLKIDPESDVEFLRGLGFEIVCEIEEGFIIVATEDIDLEKFNTKTDEFIANIKERCNSPAKIYALCDDSDRIRNILSPKLFDKWSLINDDQQILVDIGVSCSGGIKLPDRPKRKDDETDEQYFRKEQRWKEKFNAAYMAWDNLKMQRENAIEQFVSAYDGEILDFIDGSNNVTNLPDSFSARLQINGRCLRDLVLNFAYIFEVTESDNIQIAISQSTDNNLEYDIEIIPPREDAPIVCVIDSGIQEEHRYIAPAICSHDSLCLVPGSTNVNDEVVGGGHGTRVAGAILYPRYIPEEGEYQLPCKIRNFKILNSNNYLPMELFPPKLISTIVDSFAAYEKPSKIFNHSIGSSGVCEIKHMSPWAAEIDLQSYENDVLFIQSAGNIQKQVISAYIQAGYSYPNYFDRELSRICDPAQSLQALTVGSIAICDYNTKDSVALGQKDEISAFSRSGPGIWDVVKPDVVEYGGTDVINKEGDDIILTTPEEVCPPLLRRSPEGPAYAKDAVGTSFSAPKVAYIAAEIEKSFPDSPALLYRALIAQSARWPGYPDQLPEHKYLSTLRHMGYGLPNVERATHNDEYRITLITPNLLEIGEDEAHVFQIPIPEELRSVGEDYDILLEITLSYAAKPRRTRRHIKGYLSSWVDWCCSKIGESPEIFAKRVLITGASIEDDGDFQWILGEAKNRGFALNYSRKIGTLQKDWCIIKSNQLTDAFCIAVRGHKGWGSLFKAKYCLAVSFEAINQDVLIYEPIRTMIEVENQEIEVDTGLRDSN